jgi:hypothetical protein
MPLSGQSGAPSRYVGGAPALEVTAERHTGAVSRTTGQDASRYVWVPSRSGVDDFLSEYGRLD